MSANECLDHKANRFRFIAWCAPMLFFGVLYLSRTQALDWAMRLSMPFVMFWVICTFLVISAAAWAASWSWKVETPIRDGGPSVALILPVIFGVVLWLGDLFPFQSTNKEDLPTRWHVLVSVSKIKNLSEHIEQAGPSARSHPDNRAIMLAASNPTFANMTQIRADLKKDRPLNLRRTNEILALVATVGLGERPEYQRTIQRGWMHLSELRSLQRFALENPNLARANSEAAESYQSFVEL